jgi:hypothetical protein
MQPREQQQQRQEGMKEQKKDRTVTENQYDLVYIQYDLNISMTWFSLDFVYNHYDLFLLKIYIK